MCVDVSSDVLPAWPGLNAVAMVCVNYRSTVMVGSPTVVFTCVLLETYNLGHAAAAVYAPLCTSDEGIDSETPPVGTLCVCVIRIGLTSICLMSLGPIHV